APYADAYYQYDSQRRVTQAVVAGAGSSYSAGGLGTFTYRYTTSNNAAGFNSWATKTVETLPDGNQNIVFTNAYGQVMLSAYTNAPAGANHSYWRTFHAYDNVGRVILAAGPSAVTWWDTDYADLLHNVSGQYEYLDDQAGLLTTWDYYTTTAATATT